MYIITTGLPRVPDAAMALTLSRPKPDEHVLLANDPISPLQASMCLCHTRGPGSKPERKGLCALES